MSELVDELLHIDSELQDFIEKSKQPEITEPIQKIQEVAEEIGKSWSGSWLGYQSYVYYTDFQPRPPGDHFSVEWGFQDSSEGWDEYNPDEVQRVIYENAGNPDLKVAHEICKEGRILFDEKRNDIISILETVLATRQDSLVSKFKDKAEGQQIYSATDLINRQKPSGEIISRDMLAMSQGFRPAPHLVVLAEMFSLQTPAAGCQLLSNIAKGAAKHMKRGEKSKKGSKMTGTHVFIGHGGSPIWREFKDFIQDNLKLPWDEFNRVPVAGKTNITRLAEMLDTAAIAFLILTGEDEQTDGRFNPRMNVVHEAGLFQGRLGFPRAIILFEEGCQEFSNIHGLVHIQFPKGKIKAAFEEVRQVLDREGVIGS